MSTKTLIGVLLAGTIGVVIFLFVQFSSAPSGGIVIGERIAKAACNQGDKDDCLPGVDFIDTAGHAFTAKSLAGKVVVVNFWATWCGPCEGEVPDLSRVYNAYKDRGVVFLGVLTNDNPTDAELLDFQQRLAMTYPVVRGSFDLMTAFPRPPGLPTTHIYNRHGKKVYTRIGQLHEDELARLIDKLAAEPSS